MKKKYISATVEYLLADEEPVLAAQSMFDKRDEQQITPTDDEYNGEFQSRRRRDDWEFD